MVTFARSGPVPGADRRRAPAAREALVDHAFGIGWAITRHAPEPVAERLLEHAADRITRQRGSGVEQLERNLARAAPELDADDLRELTQTAMRSYFRYWHEAFRLPSWTRERVVDGVVTTNETPLREGFARGQGAIVALPHMANWDLAGAWACLTGMPVSTVAERLRPESLYERFVAYRRQLGMEVIALTGEGSPLRALREALLRGRLVCLLSDRDLSGNGVEVDLLGEPACLPGGPAVLARMTGAPLVAASLCFSGPLLRIDFSDPVPVRPGPSGLAAMTQDVADWFTAGVRRNPADWHMLQPVFVGDRGLRR
ncbi:MAG TPA: phosphatidylinositol mannoside acyltransferase [Nocardioidaceae bacterium]|jgi:KDO2-lipid IV(A) lauroyltransferase